MYEQIQNGFGAQGLSYGQREVEDLAKAMTAGYGYAGAPGSMVSGSVLMVESLEYTLHSVTWDDRHLKIWPILPKAEVWNTTHEYNRYTSHGAQYAGGGFFDADAQVLPSEVDAAFNRQIERVRYVGCTKVVTHPMTLVKTSVESAVAVEARAGTKWVLEQMERQLIEAHDYFLDPVTGLIDGDTANLPASSLKFNGLATQIVKGDTDSSAQYSGFDGYGGTTSSVYDLEGSVANEADLEQIARRQAENFGIPTHLLLDYKSHSDLNQQFQPKERINAMGVVNGQAGFVLTEFFSAAGVYKILPSRFLSPKQAPIAAQSSAPASPTIALADAGPTAGSKLVAGTYSYRVSAINGIGESAPSAASSVVVAAAASGVTITITAGGGDTTSTHYAIYRAPVGTTTGHEFVGYIKAPVVAGGAVALEIGHKAPGLASAYLLQVDPAEIDWMQLAPLMKMNLAVLSPAIRFMVLLYGMPIVYAPKHHVVARNLGRLA